MAEFMQGAVAKTKRRRPTQTAPEAEPAEPADPNHAAASTARTEAELAADAARLHDVPRAQWPADVLEYHRKKRRTQMQASREALAAGDRLRRELEQAQRREQLGDDDDDDEEPQQRDAARQRKRTKRARNNDDYATKKMPADLMTDDELAAARVAPMAAPDDDTQRRIVERVRVALSDARQGERVCAVCDELVLKCESSIGRVCEQLIATMLASSATTLLDEVEAFVRAHAGTALRQVRFVVCCDELQRRATKRARLPLRQHGQHPAMQ